MNDHPVTILNKAFTSAIPWTYFTILHLSRLDVEGVDSQRTPSSRSTQNMIQSPSRSNFALAYGLTCFGTMLGSGRISTLRIGGPHRSTRLWHNIKSTAILQTMAPRWHSHLQQQLIVSSSYKYQRPVGKEIMLGRPKMERRRLSVNLSRKQPQDHRSSWGLTETMWCSLICIIDEASPPLREIQPMKLICVAWLTYLNLEDMSFTLILNSTLILFSGLPCVRTLSIDFSSWMGHPCNCSIPKRPSRRWLSNKMDRGCCLYALRLAACCTFPEECFRLDPELPQTTAVLAKVS